MEALWQRGVVKILAGVVLAVAPSSSSLGAQAGSAYSEDTTVLAVEIPVHVTLHGEPVRGLTAENFVVMEGKRKQEIVDFEVVDLAEIDAATADPTRAALPPQARRRFLMLFDLSFSQLDSVVKARQAAHDLVVNGLHPYDLAAVATYSKARGAELVLGFTNDRRQIEEAIASLGLINPVDRVGDPLRLMLADLEVAFADPGGGNAPTAPAAQARSFLPDVDAVFIENLRDLAPAEARNNREIVKNQILDLTGSFTELAKLMNSVQGRKQVILFSEGFDSSVVLGAEDAESQAESAEAAALGEIWRVDSDARFGVGASQSELFAMLEEFRRCDCAIQAVDIGGLRAGPDSHGRPRGEESLFIMANQTGGELYRNYNRLSEAMGDLLERTSVTYLLVLQPREVALDGAYHPIKVRLKKAPKGARVVHRPGYYASVPFRAQGAEMRRLSAADLIAGGLEGGEVATSVLAAPFKAKSGDPYVLTWVEVLGHSLLGMTRARLLPVEMYAYAFDQRGALRDFFTQAAVLDLGKVGGALRSNGFKFMGHLDLPPGSYTLRVLVRNGLTGASGLQVAEVEVPRFEGGAELLPPLFIEPEDTWVLAWEERERGRKIDYPLEAGDERMIPASRPFLRAGSETPVLLVATNLGSGELSGEAWIHTEGGERRAVDLVLGDRFRTDVPGVERLWVSLLPGKVDPGFYELVVSLQDPRTGRSLESSIPVYLQ